MDKICFNCKHRDYIDIGNDIELYCYNPDCDYDFSKDEDCNNYMGAVADNDTCKLFVPRE